jgi:hypothetical protein
LNAQVESVLIADHDPIKVQNTPEPEMLEQVAGSIAPTWPLDRFIAVNPYWGHLERSFASTHSQLQRICGSGLSMPLAYYAELWQRGAITEHHLHGAMAQAGLPAQRMPVLIAALREPAAKAVGLPLLSDALDSGRDLAHEPAWRDVILGQLTQFFAAYFDQDQADWHPEDHQGLYRSWLEGIRQDHSVVVLMRAAWIAQRARQLPTDREALFALAGQRLASGAVALSELLQVSLHRISGWAAWAAYLRWQAKLAQGNDDHILDVLAVRLAWELLLDDGKREAGSTFSLWQRQWAARSKAHEPEELPDEMVWQRAHEIAYQQRLLEGLKAHTAVSTDQAKPRLQAVFCIDVRSEVYRRALEETVPDVLTSGFAGFFGLPIQYAPLGTEAMRPQLPGLLAPALTVTDTCGNPSLDQKIAADRQARLASVAATKAFERLPGSAFGLVESVGGAYLGKVLRKALPSRKAAAAPDQIGLASYQSAQIRPTLQITGEEATRQRADLAQKILQAMSLRAPFAGFILLLGHGSQSANNPHAAGLDCGACCGQTGEVNARALAELLNDSAVRADLAQRGIVIPVDTWFVPGLHNTTTDEIALFDESLVPADLQTGLAKVREDLKAASSRARALRAPKLGLTELRDDAPGLERSIKQRSNDWAQTRPEWGLANCAAFIVGPRKLTRGLDLDGRSFLHDYDFEHDADRSVLELIMTAPMVVTQWINMQYFASTVDNLRYGSGNKVLHNVVAGRIGVFEGNAGDLRIGLPMQSIHDGQRWMHEPLRLSVVIAAPPEALQAIIDKHPMLQAMLDNAWLHLHSYWQATMSAYRSGQWEPA